MKKPKTEDYTVCLAYTILLFLAIVKKPVSDQNQNTPALKTFRYFIWKSSKVNISLALLELQMDNKTLVYGLAFLSPSQPLD